MIVRANQQITNPKSLIHTIMCASRSSLAWSNWVEINRKGQRKCCDGFLPMPPHLITKWPKLFVFYSYCSAHISFSSFVHIFLGTIYFIHHRQVPKVSDIIPPQIVMEITSVCWNVTFTVGPRGHSVTNTLPSKHFFCGWGRFWRIMHLCWCRGLFTHAKKSPNRKPKHSLSQSKTQSEMDTMSFKHIFGFQILKMIKNPGKKSGKQQDLKI